MPSGAPPAHKAVRAILNDGNSTFAVRAIARNSTSARAAELEKAGAQVVEADLDDLKSLETAFAGAYSTFCVINFWVHFSPEKEIAQAGNLAQAAAADPDRTS